jgi:hypothetical protein
MPAVVKVPSRLVGQQYQRAVDERPRDGDTLLLATGKLVGATVHLLAQTNELEYLRYLRTHETSRAPDHLESKGHIFVHCALWQ